MPVVKTTTKENNTGKIINNEASSVGQTAQQGKIINNQEPKNTSNNANEQEISTKASGNPKTEDEAKIPFAAGIFYIFL